jgi:hypothetical protein
MGSVRSRDFDAVIRVGGIGGQATAEGIGGKVNWIGVGSRKEPLTEGVVPWSRSITLSCSRRKDNAAHVFNERSPITTISTKRSKRR